MGSIQAVRCGYKIVNKEETFKDQGSQYLGLLKMEAQSSVKEANTEQEEIDKICGKYQGTYLRYNPNVLV